MVDSEISSNSESLLGLLKLLRRRLVTPLRILYLIFAVLMLLFLVLVDWIGERNLFTTFFLFLPAQ